MMRQIVDSLRSEPSLDLPPHDTDLSPLLQSLRNIMETYENKDQQAVDLNEVNASLAQQVAVRVKRANNEIFQHVINQITSTRSMLDGLEQMVKQRMEEVEKRTDDHCKFITEIMVQNEGLATALNNLGAAHLLAP